MAILCVRLLREVFCRAVACKTIPVGLIIRKVAFREVSNRDTTRIRPRVRCPFSPTPCPCHLPPIQIMIQTEVVLTMSISISISISINA